MRFFTVVIYLMLVVSFFSFHSLLVYGAKLSGSATSQSISLVGFVRASELEGLVEIKSLNLVWVLSQERLNEEGIELRPSGKTQQQVRFLPNSIVKVRSEQP